MATTPAEETLTRRIAGLRTALLNARIDLEDQEYRFQIIEADAERRCYLRLDGEGTLGSNDAVRKRNLKLAVDIDEAFQDGFAALRAARGLVRGLETQLDIALDLRAEREYELRRRELDAGLARPRFT